MYSQENTPYVGSAQIRKFAAFGAFIVIVHFWMCRSLCPASFDNGTAIVLICRLPALTKSHSIWLLFGRMDLKD